MRLNQKTLSLAVVAVSFLILSACGPAASNQKSAQFSNDDQTVDQITPYVDEFANKPVKIPGE